jgi:chromosome segregation ATPase
MKQLLQEASDNEQKAAARESDMREQLTAKTRQVDEISAQLHSIEEQLASGALTAAPPVPKTRTELEEWEDDLEKEAAKNNKARRELDEERKQLREDEESLEQQMRQMEVSMAKERALMARQETELKRLSAEIQHELELMQRGDATLREQLSKFQRRAADVMQGKIGGQSMHGGPPPGKR